MSEAKHETITQRHRYLALIACVALGSTVIGLGLSSSEETVLSERELQPLSPAELTSARAQASTAERHRAPCGPGSGARHAEAHQGSAVDDRSGADSGSPQPVAGPPEPEEDLTLGLREMTQFADRIVLGRVVDSVARRGTGRDAELIFTYLTIQVEQPIKGTQDAKVEVRVLGGTLPDEDTTLHANHQPEMHLGDRGVVFIEDDPNLYTSVLGSQQGFLRFEDTGAFDGFGRAITGVANRDTLRTEAGEPMSSEQLLRVIRDLARG